MKFIYWWVHLLNRNLCYKNSFWFYGKRFCHKCYRKLEYIDYFGNKKIKKC